MSEPSALIRILTVPIMLLGGGIVAVQSEINGRLADALGSGPRAGLGAAVISFGGGLMLVSILVLVSAGRRAGMRRIAVAARSGGLRWFEVIGGLYGALLVASQGITVGTIGVALFSVAVTAGQSSSSLLVDHVGLGPSGRKPLSSPRVIAAAFAVAAVILAAGERLAEAFSAQTLVLAMMPLLAGAGAAIQQAFNGRVSEVGGPWATTFNNFAVGTIALVAVFLMSLLVGGELRTLPNTWWLYVGGAMGVVFIWLAAALVKVHGVLVLGLSLIAGQVICAELIEVFGSSTRVGIVGVAAGALTVVGVVVALLIRPEARQARTA